MNTKLKLLDFLEQQKMIINQHIEHGYLEYAQEIRRLLENTINSYEIFSNEEKEKLINEMSSSSNNE